MTVSVFPRALSAGNKNRLENITLRGFGGGWNAIETDLQMESTYLVKVRNFRRTPGGTQRIRYGSRMFVDMAGTMGGTILDMTYFAGRLVCVSTNGTIGTIDGLGNKAMIWTSGWSAGLDLINFVPYKTHLIIHNGRDKPLRVKDDFTVQFLGDAGNLNSNVNTPIGQYGCVVSNYHCIANINPNTASPKPTTIYVSAVGTDGTFPGDPVPNDAIEIDVGAYAPQGAIEIRGIAGFRSNLLVFFQDQTVIVRLGTYNGASPPVHTPVFPDTLPTFGALGHRCIVPVENDLLFSGLGGMASARRNLLSVSGTLESQSLSERIGPPYRSRIGSMTDDQQLKQCWQVYDSLSNDMLLFTPSGQVFVYSFSTKLRYSAWSEYSGIHATCGCRSFLGRVFYANGLKVYLHGNGVYANENFYQDRINDAPTPIDFEMELPWLDSKNPMQVKFLRFVGLATKGDGAFTMSSFVDNLYKDVNDTVIFTPAASMNFVGNDFSISDSTKRRSGNPRLYKFPCKFKTLKVRLSGTMGGNLEIVNMSFLFNRGKYRR